MRKELLLTFLLAAIIPSISLAQVDDVTLILSPKAGYDWFDANSTIESGLMYGFDAGFGFGNVFELRGIYRHSVDLSQVFGQYQNDISDFLNNDDFSFKSRNISVRRLGGELKANILSGKYSPFLTLGTGVQTFKRDLSGGESSKNKNIYVSLGLGLKLNISPRISFDIAGKTFIYNMDPGSLLYDPNASSAVDDFIGNINDLRMYNWQVSAGLSFYLGGVNRQKLSPLEKAYMRRYSGKLYGVKYTLAPAGAYVNFDSKSSFKDTYLLGGILGIDFSDYFGLRAYYYHSTKNKKLSFNFDKMSMYGVDFVGKLNIPRGIVPYVTVGGGYINVQDGYHGQNYDSSLPPGNQKVNSKFYVKGGLGVEIPVSTHLSLFGSANLLYTKGAESVDVADITSTDQLLQHTMFTAGLRVRFGKKANTQKATKRAFENRFKPKQDYYQQQIKDLKGKLNDAYKQNDIAKMKMIMKQKKQLENKAQRMKKESQLHSISYKHKMDSLKVELLTAYKNGNMEKMKQIMKEKKKIEARSDSLANAKGMVRMTPAELQSLINQTISKVVQEHDSTIIINKLNHLEQLILNSGGSLKGRPARSFRVRPNQRKKNQTNSNQQGAATKTTNNYQNKNPKNNAVTRELSAKIEELNRKLENQNDLMNQLQQELRSQDQPVVRIPRRNADVVHIPQARDGNVVIYNNGLLHNGFSAFLGYNLGDIPSLNLGARKYYGFRNTSFFFMPEIYIAVAQNFGLGVSANGVYQFNVRNNLRLKPYAGLGLGINFVDGNFSLNPNFILGTFYRIGRSGSVFFDYTVRGNFEYNQLAIGYRFSF